MQQYAEQLLAGISRATQDDDEEGDDNWWRK